MQTIDITAKVKNYIRFGLIGVIVLAMAIGYGEFKYWHRDETIVIDDAKIAGTMVSVRVLATGKVSELLFEDGAEVKAGDVIARLEVAITEDEIQQLENTVQLAKDNYAELAAGQTVMVPVQRERVIYQPAPPPTVHYSQAAPSGNLAALEERANRMAELFEMGAVSAVQRDAAQRAYESALAESQSSTTTYEYHEAPAPIVEHYTEYVEEFRPTPPEVLAGAEQAIRQAELSLNVARQEARETDVIAPVSGTIYYGVAVQQDLSAGESIARVGDSRELWIEVAVPEEIFDKIPLGKLVSYVIDGKELFGTVIEKIKPNVNETPDESSQAIELPDIPTSDNAPPPLIGDENSDNPSGDVQVQPQTDNPPVDEQIQPEVAPQLVNEQIPPQIDAQPADKQVPPDDDVPPVIVQPQIVKAAVLLLAENDMPDDDVPQPVDKQQPANEDQTPPDDDIPPVASDNPPADADSNVETPNQPPKFLSGTESQPKPNDKFIIKISLPAERDFDCQPNTSVTVKIKI